jgi:UDP-N-acetylmuramoyl-L-alanyl-D-glutamate--2,6-diaminopimelate ligase
LKLERLLPVLCPTPEDRAVYAPFGDVEVTRLVNNSREASRGSLFVALQGAASDGHAFVDDAVRAGARVVLSERPVPVRGDVVRFVLPDARERLSALAALFFGRPTEQLHVTGITGTNGKTTTSFRTRAVFEAAGLSTGLLGTIAYHVGDRCIPAGNTTPDSLLIQDLFDQMLDVGCSHAVIEVSSHALDMHRVDDVNFDIAVFTNLSDREHLDYHGTFENYRDAKARLFEMLPSHGTAVVSADDPVGEYMANKAHCRCLRFGMHNPADLTAAIRTMDIAGTAYRLHTPCGEAEVRTSFVGEFNVLNDLAAAACGVAAGLDLDAIVRGLESPQPVPGRLERVPAGEIFALVDYAHNEGALDSLLATVRQLARKRLIVVFGCGGDRDRTKRPTMGAVAEKYGDLVVLTADNSRSEDTEQIIREIEAGMSGSTPRQVVPDRELAIHAAVAAAQPGDVVLVAGKGHETYQILGPIKAPFDDREVLADAIAERESIDHPAIHSEA